MITAPIFVGILIAVILVESICKGYKQGLLSIVVPVISFVIAICFVHTGFAKQNMILFAIVYTILTILLRAILQPIKNSLVLGTTNRLLGAIAGLVICFLKIWVLMDIICILSLFFAPVREFNNMLMNSSIYSTLYAINPIFV